MNNEQKQRAQEAKQYWRASFDKDDVHNAGQKMAALLQELIDAPEPEQPNQSEQNLEMVNTPAPSVPELEEYDAGALNDFGGGNVGWWQDYIRAELGRAYEFYCGQLSAAPTPAPSVPDSKTLQFLTDVLTAAGLLRNGKKDANLATRIADESCRIRQQLFTQPEQPADVAQDAERYRAIRGGIVDIRDCGNTVAVEYKSVVRYCRSDEDFDQEIDAAIKRQGGES